MLKEQTKVPTTYRGFSEWSGHRSFGTVAEAVIESLNDLTKNLSEDGYDLEQLRSAYITIEVNTAKNPMDSTSAVAEVVVIR